MAAERRPDPTCPICLDCMSDSAYPDCCVHTFCFTCIKKWSTNSPQCPLCRRLINWIFQTKTKTKWAVVRSNRVSSPSVTSTVSRQDNRTRVEDDTVSRQSEDDETPSSSSAARVLPVSNERSESGQRGGTSAEQEENHVSSGYAAPRAERRPELSSASSRERTRSIRGLSWRARSTRRFRYHTLSQSLSNRRVGSLTYQQRRVPHVSFRSRSDWRRWSRSPRETVQENRAAELSHSAQTEPQAQIAVTPSENRSNPSIHSVLSTHVGSRIEEESTTSEVSVDDETPSSFSSARELPVSNERSDQRQGTFAEEEGRTVTGSVEPIGEQTPELASETEGEHVQLQNEPELRWRPRGARRLRYQCPSHSLSNWRISALPYHQRRMEPLNFRERSDLTRWSQNPRETVHGNQAVEVRQDSQTERETQFTVGPSEEINSSLVWSPLSSQDDWTREEGHIARDVPGDDETPSCSSSARTHLIFDERSESGQREGVSAEEGRVIVGYAEPVAERTPGLDSESGGERVQFHNLQDLSWRTGSVRSMRYTSRFQYCSPSQLLSNVRSGSLQNHQWQMRHTWFRDRSHWRSCSQSPSETVQGNQAAEMSRSAQRGRGTPFVVAQCEHISSPSAWSLSHTHDGWMTEEEDTVRDVSGDEERPGPSS